MPGRVPSIAAQLREHLKRLKRGRHGQITGIGLGRRRRRGRSINQLAVRILVREKPPRGQKLPKGTRRLPRTLSLVTRALGKRVVVSLPVDVEQLPEFAPTLFRAGAGTAAVYAVWQGGSGGRKRLGVLTASHTLKDAQEGVEVDAPLPSGELGTIVGDVIAKTDLAASGHDVGLIEIDAAEPRLIDAGPLARPIASREDLERLLGAGADDLKIPAFIWTSQSPRGAAVAFYPAITLPLAHGDVVLKDAVECEGPPGMFMEGRSGCCWAGTESDGHQLIIAVQSHSDTQAFRRSFGTAMHVALDWARDVTGDQGLKLAWTRAEVARLLGTPNGPPGG